MKTPQPRSRGTGTGEDDDTVVVDLDCSCGEGGGAAVVAVEADGNQRAGSKGREVMSFAGCWWKVRNGKGGGMTRNNGGAVREKDGDTGNSNAFVEGRGVDGKIMTGAAGVSHVEVDGGRWGS